MSVKERETVSKGGEKISAETVSVCVSEKDREIEERPSSTSTYVMERETRLQEYL